MSRPCLLGKTYCRVPNGIPASAATARIVVRPTPSRINTIRAAATASLVRCADSTYGIREFLSVE
ncbi:Uncharacterised protein [Mycobacteroides abscessus subsp. abscessus]|nr:Uncharacterised protein [Mycobacteroides abscessus subsp. abscessus]